MTSRPHCCLVMLALVADLVLGFLGTQEAAKPTPSNWKLVWSDEFDGKDIDRTKWDFDIGNGFFNYDANQLDRRLGQRRTAVLHPRAGQRLRQGRHAAHPGRQGVATRLRLHVRPAQDPEDATAARCSAKKYGKFEFRAKLPTGKGVWPALWMLPQDEKYGGWAVLRRDRRAGGPGPGAEQGARHAPLRLPLAGERPRQQGVRPAGRRDHRRLPRLRARVGAGRDPLVRRRQAVSDAVVLVEQQQGRTAARARSRRKEADLNPWPAPFDQPFYLVMNVAVGGKFLGNPDKTTAFPAEMLVDYVGSTTRSAATGSPSPAARESCRLTNRNTAFFLQPSSKNGQPDAVPSFGRTSTAEGWSPMPRPVRDGTQRSRNPAGGQLKISEGRSSALTRSLTLASRRGTILRGAGVRHANGTSISASRVVNRV